MPLVNLWVDARFGAKEAVPVQGPEDPKADSEDAISHVHNRDCKNHWALLARARIDDARSASNGKFANTMTRFLDDDNRAAEKLAGGLIQDRLQSGDHVLAARVVEAEQDYANYLARRACENLAKIEIESQHDPSFAVRLLEDFAVGQSLKAFVSEM